MRVAQTAPPAARDEDALTGYGEIGEQTQRFVRIAGLFVHERAQRNGELEIRARVARAVRALAMVAAPRSEFGMEAVIDQGVRVRVRDDENRSAVAAVAAARSAPRHKLLAAERKTAPPAVACSDVDVDLVYKHTIGELTYWRVGD